jgi:hypothetical protein
MKGAGIGLMHSHGYKASVFGTMIRSWSGIPILATCHLWFQGSSRPLKMRLMLAAEKRAYRSFRHVVGVSADIRRTLIGAGLAPERIQVVENGVEVGDLPRIDAERAARLRADLGLDEDSFVVFNAARVNQQKGQWNLIEAAAKLRAVDGKIRFVIVGEGPLEAELRERARKLGVEDIVRFGGFRDDVDDLLQIVDVFALPSLDEGMPMSLLEAVARRVPVITTDVGDIGRVIADGQSGWIIPVEDAAALAEAIGACRRDPEESARRAGEALRRVEESYSSAAMYGRYAKIYEQYFETTPSRGGSS